MITTPSFRLRLFGGASLTGVDGGPLSGRATQRHRLALLAFLARSPGVGVSRDVLMAHLWPESDVDQARNLLKVSVYVLRQALGDGAILSVPEGLRLSTDVVDVDVIAFESALERGDRELAVSLYRGPFLEGFFLRGAPEFGQWADRERSRLSDAQARALEFLAEDSERHGRARSAIEWWKARAAHDPYDSRVALRLMECFLADGNRGGAIRYGRVHVRLLAEELGIEPTREVLAFLESVNEESADGGRAPQQPDAEHIEPEVVPVVEPTQRAPAPAARSVAPVRRSGRRWALPAAAVLVVGAATLALVRPWVGEAGSVPASGSTAEEIAEAVVRQLGAAPPVRSVSPTTSDVTAWELYRRASQPEVIRSDSAAQEALTLFREAIEIDPTFAAAYAGAARMHLRVPPPEDPDMPRAEQLQLARQNALRATALDSLLVEAYGTMGLAEMFLYRFADAEAHLQRARRLDPSVAVTREWLVSLYIFTGRFTEALEEARGALEVDPLSASGRAELGRALVVNGRCDESLEQVVPLASLRSPLLRAGPIAAECYAQRGMWDEALAHASIGRQSSGLHGRAWLGHYLARAGRTAEARAILAELREWSLRTGSDAFWVALVLAGLGQVDDAFDWLERSVDDYSITYEVREPAFSRLHEDPRFEELFDRMERMAR